MRKRDKRLAGDWQNVVVTINHPTAKRPPPCEGGETLVYENVRITRTDSRPPTPDSRNRAPLLPEEGGPERSDWWGGKAPSNQFSNCTSLRTNRERPKAAYPSPTPSNHRTQKTIRPHPITLFSPQNRRSTGGLTKWNLCARLFFMAKHSVTLNLHQKLLQKKDTDIEVKIDGRKLGTVLVSQGNLEWLPANNSVNKYRLTWSRFAEVMEQNGNLVKK